MYPSCSKGEKKEGVIDLREGTWRKFGSKGENVETGDREGQKGNHLHNWTQRKGNTSRGRTTGQRSPTKTRFSFQGSLWVSWLRPFKRRAAVQRASPLLAFPRLPMDTPLPLAEGHYFIGLHTTILAFLLILWPPLCWVYFWLSISAFCLITRHNPPQIQSLLCSLLSLSMRAHSLGLTISMRPMTSKSAASSECLTPSPAMWTTFALRHLLSSNLRNPQWSELCVSKPVFHPLLSLLGRSGITWS